MSKCTATFNINTASGTPAPPIELVVPDISELTLDLAIEELLKDREKYSQLLDVLNKSGMPSPSVKESDFNKDISVGNAAIYDAANVANSPEAEYLLKKLEELGVNTSLQNVLFSTAKFTWGNRSPFKMFSKGDKSLAVVRPNTEGILPFLKSLTALEAYNNSDSKDEISGIISSILQTLSDSDHLRIDRILKAIDRSKNPTIEFIKYFHSSSAFVSALKNARLFYQAKAIMDELIGSEELENSKYTDPLVLEFADLAFNMFRDGEVSMDEMEKVLEKLGVDDPVKAVLLLNNRITYGPYFEIKFMGKDRILFKKAKRKPLLEMDVINSEYYGELVTPVASIDGFNIVEFGGLYFVSDKILTTVEDLAGQKGSSSLNHARGTIVNKLQNLGLNAMDYKNLVKQGDSTFESRKKLAIGDTFIVTDVELGKYNNYPGNKDLLKWKYGEFFTKLRSHPLWKYVISNLSEEGISIENILTTPEKVETFIALLDKFADRERYKELYNNNTPRVDTPEKIEYSTNLARLALLQIENAEDVVYRIVAKLGYKYKIERVLPELNIPVYTKKAASFKSELVTIADYLENTFGVKTHLVTSSEIYNDFALIIPNAARSNAFIYNNEIYINVDKATTADALHEYAHIVMGTIKQNSPDLYYGLLSKIEDHPLYALKLSMFKGDKRARTDLNEEIFVDIFGEYCARRMNPWFNDKTVQMDELKEKFKQGTLKMLLTGEDISSESVNRLLHMSINDIMTEFGSTLSEPDPKAFNMDLAYLSRVVSNLISKLMNSNNPDTNIIETCE